MSSDGQAPTSDVSDDECRVDGPIAVMTFPMPPGLVFDWHTHADHQLAWASSGVLTVRTASAAWVLPPTRALWIPAGIRHETLSDGAATMRAGYVNPDLCPVAWTECTPVVATPLLTQLIGYLDTDTLDDAARANAMAVLLDVLQPANTSGVDVRMPVEERALEVAEALAATPADNRSLSEWGMEVGASSRTLSRAFLADTGLTFGRWRARVRLQAAMVALAGGASVSRVAGEVGYESTSAFVSAFRRETGVTPASYFRVPR